MFDNEVISEIIKKVKDDKSGRLGILMGQMMDIAEKAGDGGFTMKEISIIITTGWYLSQNPEMKEFFKGLMAAPPIPQGDDDIYN
jgi:hypothetical protein|tara:strand:+ start:557 stop:811 length:255 start_codon:yes stop_codon:yes gene_type:complete